MLFKNRKQAGLLLAAVLEPLIKHPAVVIALPRGGIPVAVSVAKRYGLPLTVLSVRKIGHPQNPEFALDALAEGGTRIFDTDSLSHYDITIQDLEEIIKKETKELKRRAVLYRNGLPFPDISGKQAIIVDDGIATGITVQAAIAAVRKLKPASVVVASPVVSKEIKPAILQTADTFVSVIEPDNLSAIGDWYKDFSQVTDDQVLQQLSFLKKNG